MCKLQFSNIHLDVENLGMRACEKEVFGELELHAREEVSSAVQYVTATGQVSSIK